MNKKGFLYNVFFSKIEKVLILVKKSIYIAWYRHHFIIPPKALLKYAISFVNVLKRGSGASNLYTNQKAYLKWYNSTNQISSEVEDPSNKYSFLVVTKDTSEHRLEKCLDSLLAQNYPDYEIIVVDNASHELHTLDLLQGYVTKKGIQVTFLEQEETMSSCLNIAASKATGDYLLVVDDEDIILENALVEVANYITKTNDEFVYSDEDLLDEQESFMQPHFKADYSPDTLLGFNYIHRLFAIKKTLFEAIGGYDPNLKEAYDYDLVLKAVEKANHVGHITKILYHGRVSTLVTNDSTYYQEGKKVVEETLKRRNIEADVLENENAEGTYLIHYHHNVPLVSMIIPMRDQAAVSKRCFDSIIEKTAYKNYEIIVADNNSCEQATADLLKEYSEKYDFFKVVRLECEFNYSYINNEAAKYCNGEYLLFLNNDTEVLTSDWLDYMVGYASQEHIGNVGIKLYYPDDLVQHAGVVLGYGGIAGHIYVTYNADSKGVFNRLTMPYDYSAVTAACMMLKKSKFDAVGGFDEKLAVALNDVDLNIKILDQGYYNICLNNVIMYHYESKSRGYDASKEKHERYLAEQAYITNKWKESIEEDHFFSEHNF